MSVRLTHDVYDRAALGQAIAEYRERLKIVVDSQNEAYTTLAFAGCAPDRQLADVALIRDFLNRALELSIPAKLQSLCNLDDLDR